MRGKFSAVIREFEEGGGGGFLANKEKLLILSEFQGVILHLFPRFGDISPCRKGQERRTGGASSGSSPITHSVTLRTLCFGGSSVPGASRIWDVLQQLQQQLQGPHSLRSRP